MDRITRNNRSEREGEIENLRDDASQIATCTRSAASYLTQCNGDLTCRHNCHVSRERNSRRDRFAKSADAFRVNAKRRGFQRYYGRIPPIPDSICLRPPLPSGNWVTRADRYRIRGTRCPWKYARDFRIADRIAINPRGNSMREDFYPRSRAN